MEEEKQEKAKSLKETLEELSQDLKEIKGKEKTKFWSLPWSAKLGMGRNKKRKGYVVFINIGMNKAITFIKAPITDNAAIVNGVPHVVKPEDVLIWKNRIPIVIQPQWSEKPFSPREHFEEAYKNQEGTMGYQFIMNKLMTEALLEKKKMSGGIIIIGILAIIGLGYYLFKSGAI